MAKRLTFTVEVEDDQEVPEIGEMFDVQNDTITFLDAALVSVEDVPDDASQEVT